ERVEAFERFRQHERLTDGQLQNRRRKTLFERLFIDGDRALAGAEENPGRRRLASARAVVLRCGQDYATSSACGCCALCGCSAPAYTLSLRYIALPSFVLGSMPKTASSTSRTGSF